MLIPIVLMLTGLLLWYYGNCLKEDADARDQKKWARERELRMLERESGYERRH